MGRRNNNKKNQPKNSEPQPKVKVANVSPSVNIPEPSPVVQPEVLKPEKCESAIIPPVAVAEENYARKGKKKRKPVVSKEISVNPLVEESLLLDQPTTTSTQDEKPPKSEVCPSHPFDPFVPYFMVEYYQSQLKTPVNRVADPELECPDDIKEDPSANLFQGQDADQAIFYPKWIQQSQPSTSQPNELIPDVSASPSSGKERRSSADLENFLHVLTTGKRLNTEETLVSEPTVLLESRSEISPEVPVVPSTTMVDPGCEPDAGNLLVPKLTLGSGPVVPSMVTETTASAEIESSESSADPEVLAIPSTVIGSGFESGNEPGLEPESGSIADAENLVSEPVVPFTVTETNPVQIEKPVEPHQIEPAVGNWTEKVQYSKAECTRQESLSREGTPSATVLELDQPSGQLTIIEPEDLKPLQPPSVASVDIPTQLAASTIVDKDADRLREEHLRNYQSLLIALDKWVKSTRKFIKKTSHSKVTPQMLHKDVTKRNHDLTQLVERCHVLVQFAETAELAKKLQTQLLKLHRSFLEMGARLKSQLV